MVCPDLKTTYESKEASFAKADTYSLTRREEFSDCLGYLCPCYSERDKKQYCSKYRPEPKEN